MQTCPRRFTKGLQRSLSRQGETHRTKQEGLGTQDLLAQRRVPRSGPTPPPPNPCFGPPMVQDQKCTCVPQKGEPHAQICKQLVRGTTMGHSNWAFPPPTLGLGHPWQKTRKIRVQTLPLPLSLSLRLCFSLSLNVSKAGLVVREKAGKCGNVKQTNFGLTWNKDTAGGYCRILCGARRMSPKNCHGAGHVPRQLLQRGQSSLLRRLPRSE